MSSPDIDKKLLMQLRDRIQNENPQRLGAMPSVDVFDHEALRDEGMIRFGSETDRLIAWGNTELGRLQLWRHRGHEYVDVQLVKLVQAMNSIATGMNAAFRLNDFLLDDFYYDLDLKNRSADVGLSPDEIGAQFLELFTTGPFYVRDEGERDLSETRTTYKRSRKLPEIYVATNKENRKYNQTIGMQVLGRHRVPLLKPV